MGRLVFGEVVHPAGKLVLMTMGRSHRATVSGVWALAFRLLRLPVWIGSDKDKQTLLSLVAVVAFVVVVVVVVVFVIVVVGFWFVIGRFFTNLSCHAVAAGRDS